MATQSFIEKQHAILRPQALLFPSFFPWLFARIHRIQNLQNHRQCGFQQIIVLRLTGFCAACNEAAHATLLRPCSTVVRPQTSRIGGKLLQTFDRIILKERYDIYIYNYNAYEISYMRMLQKVHFTRHIQSVKEGASGRLPSTITKISFRATSPTVLHHSHSVGLENDEEGLGTKWPHSSRLPHSTKENLQW